MSDHRNDLFDRLFAAHYQKVYSFFVRRGFTPDESSDLTQATFMRVYENMSLYRGGDSLTDLAFLMSVTKTVWRNELRRRGTVKRGKTPDTLDDPENPILEGQVRPLFGPVPSSPEETAARNERIEALRRRVLALPPRMRRALMLRVSGLSYRELAVAMRTTVDAIKKLLYDARKRLREEAGSGAPGVEEPGGSR